MSPTTAQRILLAILIIGALWMGYCTIRGVDAYLSATSTPPPDNSMFSSSDANAFSQGLSGFALQVWLIYGAPGIVASFVAGIAIALISNIRWNRQI